MFFAHLSFILSLIALVLGSFLLLHVKDYKDRLAKLCNVVGYMVMILSFLMMVISGYSIVERHFMKKKMPNAMHRGASKQMMHKMHKKKRIPFGVKVDPKRAHGSKKKR